MSDRLSDLLELLESAQVRVRIRQMIDALASVGDDDARALEAAVDARLRGKTDRLFSIMSAASAGGGAAMEALLLAQHQIAKHTDLIAVRSEMGKAISIVTDRIGSALLVSVGYYMSALEGTLIRGVIALRVLGVEGIFRGSVRSVHGMLAESPRRGFLKTDSRIVAVLDFDRLLGHRVRTHGQTLGVA